MSNQMSTYSLQCIAITYQRIASKLSPEEYTKIVKIYNTMSEISEVKCKLLGLQMSSKLNSFLTAHFNIIVEDNLNIKSNIFKISLLKNKSFSSRH